MVDWMFAQMWEYTKLTFRIFAFLFRWIVYGVSLVLNRRAATQGNTQDDLLNPRKSA